MADTAWFNNDRFGMFVHWGLYSIPAGVWKGRKMDVNWYAEWIQLQGGWPKGIPVDEYRALASGFNPVGFDADEWIREAKNAGIRYFLITSKHHDGFALWPSKVSDYNIVDATPFKRDVLAELCEACAKHGIELGFYYSHWLDWEHPGGAMPKATEGSPPRTQPSPEAFELYWTEKCLPQVKELLENYDPKFFWFDNWREDAALTEDRLDRLIGLIRGHNPDCLINSRIGTTWNHSRGDEVVDYLSMDDNHFPDVAPGRSWETSGTFNRSWGYHQLDHKWLSAGEIIRNLIHNVSLDGNYQINIGPKADGSVPAPSIRRLREVGAWMDVHGESVYGAGAAGIARPQWGFATKGRGRNGLPRLYLHVIDQPGNGTRLTCEAPDEGVTACSVLETGEQLPYTIADGVLAFDAPEFWPDERITVIAFDLAQDAG